MTRAAAPTSLEASTALAGLAEKNGVPSDRIIGRGTSDVGIVVQLDADGTNWAMLTETENGGWNIHVGGSNFGRDGATVTFAGQTDAIAALSDIMKNFFGGCGPKVVH